MTFVTIPKKKAVQLGMWASPGSPVSVVSSKAFGGHPVRDDEVRQAASALRALGEYKLSAYLDGLLKKSNPSTRYRKVVKVSRKRNPEGWHEYLTGGVKNWSKTLSSGAKIVITEPWKGGWSMYQVNYHPPGKSYGTAHFSNADTLSEAFAAGNRAVKYYEAQKRNPATSDAQVIKAFTEQRAASSSRLHTDGRRLDGLWMGGNGIAVWEGGKIHFSDLGSKATQRVQRAVVKEAPRNWIGAGSEWALPKRRNPPSSGLGGTYVVTHANPFGLFKRKPSPKFAVGNAVSFKSGGATGVVLGKQWWDGAWHYEISWPKGYSSTGITTEHEGILRHARRNPDLSGPLTITHDGPDLHITHKANPRRRKR